MAIPRKAPIRYDDLTREQLVARLRTLEDARDAERERLADLYDFAPVVYIGLDPETRITDANLTAAALFGIERGKLIGKPLSAIVTTDDRHALREHVRRCVQEQIRVESEIAFSVRHQPSVIAQVTSVPSFAPDGRVTGCRTTVVDITAFKRAQEKLRFLALAGATLGSSFDYRATLAQVARQAVPVLADVCIVDVVEGGDLRRHAVACSDPAKAEQLAPFHAIATRADENTAVGRVLHTKEPLLFPECSPAALASTAEGFDHEILIKVSGARSMMVVPMVARDRVFGVITLIAAESGRQYSGTSLSTARDLATHAALAVDNARLYERTQQAVHAREDVLSFVSHDLRNPLMGIQLTAETLLRSERGGDERRKGWKHLERIRRGVLQMRRMIDDLLDVASLESGRLAVTTVPHEVSTLFDDTFATLSPLAEAKGLTLRIDSPADRLAVRCDPERVLQVLSNLIGNSLKFTPAGGSITVTARATGTQVLFSVRDTGSGISPLLRPHIFERFWQAEEAARKGRGLGLYIAKGLVEAQSGSIWVDSPEGGGSTFSFTLPLASAAEVDSLKAATSDPVPSPREAGTGSG